jgi:hypothetical protein
MSVLPLHDNLASYKVLKETLFDLPMKLLVIGRSELSGKSTLICNLLLRPFDETDIDGKLFYRGDFKGENIYIVNPSIHLDTKFQMLISSKRVPEANIYSEYNEDELLALYERLSRQYDRELAEGFVSQKLIVLDDCAHSGDLKSKTYGFLTRVACNGRHLGISLIVTSQKYSAISPLIRENATGVILYECSGKQLDLVAEDHAIQPKREFEKMFREATREKHSFMAINYSNDVTQRFLNSNFSLISQK